MRKLKITPTESYNWKSSAASCTIHPTFIRHSGEYWCEDAEGNQSDVLNISITDGSVILDVPARPVVAGYDVILHCRKEKTQAKHIADFYKDGVKLGTWYENNMTIHNVSKSDEGLYKCRISGAGESPESWLSVLNQNETAYEETRPSNSDSLNLSSLLWTAVFAALGLLVMGLHVCRKHRGTPTLSPRSIIYILFFSIML
uniref:Immunoglobulin domain-containing protein n=1 Tax=Dicentrarchus labrax TaxID=13489 RepID=A0A8P4G002_DICLA